MVYPILSSFQRLAQRAALFSVSGALLLVFLLLTPVHGQSVNSGIDDDVTGDTVLLSPFEVNSAQDVGYRATNSTSGTSLNTPIRELPMSIQVITAEFISDIGATDLEEALTYSAGVFTESQEAPGGNRSANANQGGGSNEKSASASARGNRFANVVTIRGFDVPFQTRLGFRVGGIVVTPTTNIALGGLLDSLNLDRLEVVKGPNSLLYGIGVLSGIVNAIPKKPSAIPSYKLSAGAGNHGFLRGTVDATGPLIKDSDRGHSMNFRIGGAWDEREHYTDWQSKEQRYYLAQLDYRFKDKVSGLLEFQTSDTKFNGTGDQWIYDNGGGTEPLFRNEWDEQYNFARQVGPIEGLGRMDRRIITVDAAGRPLRTPRVELFYVEPDPTNREMMGGGLPDTYRITGPDTYEQRDEDNILLNLDLTPNRSLALSAGVYYTQQDTEELAINAQNVNNSEGGYNIRQNIAAIGPTEYTVDEVWSVTNPFFVQRDSQNPADVNPNDNIKLTRFWWSKRPTSSESLQWRVRATYTFDADLPLLGESNHTFLVGNNFINDTVRFLNGEERAIRAYNRNTFNDDALYFRPIDDFSVFRYNGEKLAMPGNRYSEQDIWFKGYYGVYQGKFWDEKVGAILGLRYDEYNATTQDFIRLPPERTEGLTKEQIQAQEIGWVDNPDNTIYGAFDPTLNFPEPISKLSKMAGLNYKINDTFTVFGLYSEGLAPNTGLTDGNNKFIDAEETVSKEIGIKFSTRESKLSGSLSVYQIERKNAIWDFRYGPAPAKWTGSPNPPVGFALTSNRFDPIPTVGKQTLSYGINAKETPVPFATGFAAGSSSTVDPNTLWKTYYITTKDPSNQPIRQLIPGLIDFSNPGGRADDPQTLYVRYADMDTPFDFSYTKDGQLVTEHYTWRQFFEKAFFNDTVSADVPGQYDPIRYAREDGPFGDFKGGNNPSVDDSSGANVTFNDEAKGADLELIYQPRPNLQFLFNYSYTERSAKGAFHLLDFISLEDGNEYAGTEYDRVVRVFGREAFGIVSEDTDGDGFADKFLDQHGNEISEENPLHLSEAILGIDGVSLFFNPAHQATFWGKYDITEGKLRNLGFGLGVRYASAAPTSISIGGDRIGKNLFPTPATAVDYSVDAGLYYNFKAGRTRWSVRLNISNLLDDEGSVTTAEYYDEYNERTVNKRTENFKVPRSYRFNVSVEF